jgi:hypothetical protein
MTLENWYAKLSKIRGYLPNTFLSMWMVADAKPVEGSINVEMVLWLMFNCLKPVAQTIKKEELKCFA